MSTSREEVLGYFKEKADGYDLVDQQWYWVLSDSLLWDALVHHVFPKLPDDFVMLDAGGGTGRWTDRILSAFPKAQAVIFDISPDMTKHAQEKARRNHYEERLTIAHGDLEQVQQHLKASTFDLIISFHNVMGFVNPEQVMPQLASLSKPGGLVVLFVPNRYHAAFFNIFQANIELAEDAINHWLGKFVDDMPSLNLYSPSSLRNALQSCGLHCEWLSGFPSLVYPGYEETRIEGSSIHNQELLRDPVMFRRIFDLEKSVAAEPDAAARGNNLFVVAAKVVDGGRS